MNSSFVPLPIGHISGPFTCGVGTDPNGGVQFAVRDTNGAWRYVIEPKKYAKFEGALMVGEAIARTKAERLRAEILAD